MHDEPKSMIRYLAMAALAVAPVLYFISAHVDQKVAPVSGYVVQTFGVTAQDSKLARVEKLETVR